MGNNRQSLMIVAIALVLVLATGGVAFGQDGGYFGTDYDLGARQSLSAIALRLQPRRGSMKVA